MRGVALVVWCAVTGPVVAENPTFQQKLEMPAHRSLFSVMTENGAVLQPFETDGCSGGMSWSWRLVSDLFPDFEAAQGATPPWETCCVIHDRVYHNAGAARSAEDSYAARLAADEALRTCVVNPSEAELARLADQYNVSEESVGQAYSLIGDAMFNAVRLGGAPCSGLPWRWGFGYAQCLPDF